MNKGLFLSGLVLLCCLQAWTLKCVICEYRFFAFTCLRGRGVCTAELGQVCKKEYIKKVGKMIFIRKGCTKPEDICHYTKGDNRYSKMTLCCDAKDFCNQ